MDLSLFGIRMSLIPHPQNTWLEGVTPVTNLQWRNGLDRVLKAGGKYALYDAGPSSAAIGGSLRHFSNFQDLADAVGRGNVPRGWKGEAVHLHEPTAKDLFFFKWNLFPSWEGFDGDGQPVMDVTWAEAKAWTLTHGGLFLLDDWQWHWSCLAGEGLLFRAMNSGRLEDQTHWELPRGETTTDVDDHRYPDGPFGLRHKLGNVWEWVERMPTLSDEDWLYAVRGGSWDGAWAEYFKICASPIDRQGYGFRVGAPSQKG